MKTLRAVPAYVLALALLPLGGCLEIAVKTSISPDGSSERVISVKRPSKGLPEHGYPVPGDPSWAGEWKETGDKDLPYEYVARKHFSTPEELSAEYGAGRDSGALAITVSVDRSFEWFYSYVDYRETYTLRNPFRRIPPEAYFAGDEIGRIALGEKSDSLNRKIEEWDLRNFLEEYVERLADAVPKDDTVLTRSRLAAAKEDLLRLIREDSSDGKEDEVSQGLRILSAAVGVRDLGNYRGALERVLAEVDSMRESRSSADRWASSVVMPGLLVSANGETVEGNEVRWTIESKQLLVTPVAMEARSRVTNAWAFAVTAGIALLLLVPAFFGWRRRRILR